MAVRMDPNASTIAAHSKPAQVDANDFKQFAAMRRADPNDPKTLREVSRQFESLFTKMMLESMRSASMGDPMFGSDQADMYQGMMDDQLAVQLSSGRGIGLADMLFRQLQGGAAGNAGAGLDVTAPGKDVARHVTPEQRREFVDQLLPHATAAAHELGVDPRAIVAQAALETGWGTHLPADAKGDSHNYFGIKATDGWKGASVAADTTEYTTGAADIERAQFRAYGSVAENLADYVRVLRDNPRYAAALGTGSDVGAFANALQRGGYATDPDYASKLLSVVSRVDEIQERAVRPEIAANVKPFKPEAQPPIATPRINNA
jgi:peptidoglycan hydrolase FlgJ